MRAVIFLLYFYSVFASDIDEYFDKRYKILKSESRLSLGGNVTLSDKEAAVNICLMHYKFKEVDYWFDNPRYFNCSRHYFIYKQYIKTSKVFRIIQDMPKGAALHVHDMGLLGPDYLMNITYQDNLYVCFDNNLHLIFANAPPKSPCDGKWQLMSKARSFSNNVTKFDADLRNHFTLFVKNPDTVYPSIIETWRAFMKFFLTVQPMLSYRPVWEQYFYDALKKFREDNIMYLEVRSILPNLYELDGTVYDPIVTAKTYKKVIKNFMKDHRDFLGAKLIYAPPRKVDRSKLEEYLELAKRIKQEMPDKFAGFDLVGQEDLGSPLIEFVPQLLESASELNYFFHAGETDWYGTLTDENLVDAVLLGAKRLGHAYALPKHPQVLNEIIKKDIGLEVNVISNAVLSLVRDIRNHPLSAFLAHGLPVVLSSDDPGVWEADPLSEDFYIAFVAVASRLSDLRMLKQLAINSLKYSALDSISKVDALRKFNYTWNEFIDNFNCSKYQH
ncbi:adenosine deaminase 2-A-like [Papilio machaon]|uniref:adenosine deaminase 2-A-like n=1 Tax=Papilio machaon TaxID=76193 RepID=UPI001E663FA9|nr:adenosine deaminase 2-A-like [Papilio machaon]